MTGCPRLWLSALLILPAACSTGQDGGSAQNQAAAAGTEGGSNAAADTASGAQDGVASAPAPAAGGPCPYQTRNWRVTVAPSDDQGGGLAVNIAQEVHPDDQGRYPMISATEQAPELILEIEADPYQSPQAGGDWMETGSSSTYDPAFTHVVVRCAGTQVARLPIPRPQ